MKKVIYSGFLVLILATACTNKTKQAEAANKEANTNANPASETIAPATKVDKEKSLADAKAKIEDIRKKVISKEMTIGEAAEQYSDDPGSNKAGGRYNNIARGQFVPEFEKVAFALKPGEISEVFQTQYGFHFVQLIARHDDLVDVSHVLVIPK